MDEIPVDNDINIVLADDVVNQDIESLEMEPGPSRPGAAEIEDTEKARKSIFNAAVTTIVLSGGGIVEYFSLEKEVPGNSYYKVVLVIYGIAIFATFLFGMALLVLSFVLQHLRISVDRAKTLLWVAFVLVKIAICLRIIIHVIR